MDFVAQAGVNISRSVLVSGVTNTSADEEIIDQLRTYGTLKVALPVSDPKSTFYKNLIIEFEEESAFTDLEGFLPYTYTSPTTAGRVYRITALANEYAATAPSSGPSPNYLRTFKEIAESSGTRFEDVLKAVMDQIQEHLDKERATEDSGIGNETKGKEDEDAKTDVTIAAQTVLGPDLSLPPPRSPRPPPGLSHTGQQGTTRRRHTPDPEPRVSLTHQDLNPPEIQRVVVEHVVRNTGHGIPSLHQLRTFSGRVPKPSAEADFDSWRSQIDLLLADPNLSALSVTRRIIESLLTPAADLVKGLGPDTLPTILLRILDSAFGTVQDGEELYAQFLNILQNAGERPSTYLQRLQVKLNTVVRRGGIQAAEMDRHLLKQFVRGCWENALIMKLQLERRRENPPPFSELLLMLRTEEDRQQAKETLMKRHIASSSSKPKANIQSHSVCSCGHKSPSDELKELRKQMAELQRQMSAFMSSQQHSPAPSKPATRLSGKSSQPAPKTTAKPKPWYCFHCGEDGHVSSSCTNPANPTLVEQKRKELRKKQQVWTTKNTPSSQLN
uniref:CCHC-type domain-containing protein n=1 Tax=Amphiprion ocellaris TaxID=80972 RepID=A0AAQ6A554_AMPOC